MKFNGNLMWFLSAFYVLVAAGYAVWYANTHVANPSEADLGIFPFPFEPIGTAAILMLAIMAAFLAFYIAKTAKSQARFQKTAWMRTSKTVTLRLDSSLLGAGGHSSLAHSVLWHSHRLRSVGGCSSSRSH